MSFLKRSVLAARTLFYVLMATLLVFVLVTTVGVSHERQRIMQLTHNDVQKVVQHNTAAIAGVLWNYDTAALKTLLQGMTRFGAIIRLEVRDEHSLVASEQQPGKSMAADETWSVPLPAPGNGK